MVTVCVGPFVSPTLSKSSDDEEGGGEGGGGAGGGGVEDKTEVDIVTLRRTIYLTIMSALDFEETCHKLMKLKIPDGLEVELINMVLECCSQVWIWPSASAVLLHPPSFCTSCSSLLHLAHVWLWY